MMTVKSHITDGSTRIVQVTDTFPFRGQEFTVTSECYECVDTGEQFTTTDQDEALVQEVRRQWREFNNVPSPEELTARRKALGLSGNDMARLLGLGINQYRQYEKGEFPSESKARLLQLAVNQRALPVLIEAAKTSLSKRTLDKLRMSLTPGLQTLTLPKIQPFSFSALVEPSMYNGGSGGCVEAEIFALPSVSRTFEEPLLR